MKRKSLFTLFLAGSFTILACGCKSSAKKAWTDVVSKCTSSDDVPKRTMLYFGPSNKIGPGSVWRKRDNGYGLRFALDDAIRDPSKRDSMITNGAPADCKGTSKTSWKLKPSVVLESVAAPWSADIKTALSHSRDVQVSVSSWRLDRLKELPYEKWLKSSDSGDYGKDLLGPNSQSRRVMTEAIRISGFSADLNFENTVAANLKAKYPAGVKLGGGLTGEWKNTTTLHIKSDSDFYIGGVLRPLDQGAIGVTGIDERLLSKTADVPADTDKVQMESIKDAN